MFYRLELLNGEALPATISRPTSRTQIARGGLILEPAEQRDEEGGSGYAVLQVVGRAADRDLAPELLFRLSEPYRIVGQTAIEVGRGGRGAGVVASGFLVGERLTLRVAGALSVMAADTTLSFAAAPSEPVSQEWSDVFAFGGALSVATTELLGEEGSDVRRPRLMTHGPGEGAAALTRLANAWKASV